MQQISQQQVQQSLETGVAGDADLGFMPLAALHDMRDKGALNQSQLAALQSIDDSMSHTSTTLYFILASAFDAPAPVMDRDCIAAGLSRHEVVTLERLTDLLLKSDPATAARLKSEISAGGSKRAGAEKELADKILASADSFKMLLEITKILVADQKNIHLQPLLFAVLGNLALLQKLSAELLKDVVREGNSGSTASLTDSVASDAQAQAINARNNELDYALKLKAAEALQQAVKQSAVEKQIELLKEKIIKVKDAIVKDFELANSGPVKDRYAHIIAFNQERAEEGNLAAKLRDYEAQDPVKVA